jgi:predicted PurR-regulated permease PerM
MSRRLQFYPMAVLVGMWLLWAPWGVAEVVLAVPLLISIKVLAAHVESLHSLQPLIGALPLRWSRNAPARQLRSADGKLSPVP